MLKFVPRCCIFYVVVTAVNMSYNVIRLEESLVEVWPTFLV